MTTLSQLRKAALALPEVEEANRSGGVEFSVRGREFAAATQDGHVQLHLAAAEAKAALAAHPGGKELVRGGKSIGFQAPLADINGKDLNDLVRKAWANRAPKELAAAITAAVAGTTPADWDVPSSIGKPATRALLSAGLTNLAQIATWSEAELLDLHGIGPRAIRILNEALAERGMSLR